MLSGAHFRGGARARREERTEGGGCWEEPGGGLPEFEAGSPSPLGGWGMQFSYSRCQQKLRPV